MPFYKFKNSSETTAEIEIYGEIVETRPKSWWTGRPLDGLFFVSEEFNEQIEQLKNKSKITLKINSPGGDLFVGVGVYNQLKQLNAEIEVIVEGIAASAAGVIACAGDTVRMGTGAVIMAHQASGTMYDTYVTQTDCEMKAKQLEACNNAIADIISKKTGKSVDEIIPLLKEELWLTGQSAVDFGFADELLETEEEPFVNDKNKNIYSNGRVFPIKNYIKNAEKHLTVLNESKNANTSAQADDDIKNKTKEDTPMAQETKITLDVLKKEYPDIVKKIEDAAIKTERARQKSIDEIAPRISDKTILDDAKYGDSGISAEVLALQVLKQEKNAGEDFLAKAKQDVKDSGAEDVESSPSGEEDEQTQLDNEIKNAVAIFNKSKED